LIGVRLFAKIKKTYQVNLELAALFEARTVRQLADLIRKSMQPAAAEAKTWSTLVPIQPNGSRVPLFCIHAIGGDVLFYEQLAKALGPDQPFYAFRSPLLSQADIRETSVEELASIYVKELRAFYPQGPYLLGGLSFGGLVALEMSQQLCAQGVEPGSLILFDTFVPGSAGHVKATAQLSTFWRNFRRQGVDYVAHKALLKRDYWRRLLRERIQGVTCACYRLAGRDLPADLRYYLVGEAHTRAMMRYNIRTYPGKITLMRVQERDEVLSKHEDPNLGWGSFAGGALEILDVPSDHTGMLLQPYVRNVAKMLKTILPA
jgi:aspartate racemase